MNKIVKKGAPVRVKWDLIDGDWKAGIKSMQAIADSYEEATGKKITPAGIKKHYDDLGIPRDLAGKIKAKNKVKVEIEKDQNDSSGFIYVIFFEDSGKNRFYKIGMSVGLNGRLASHQCSSPFELYVACGYYVSNMRMEEMVLHQMFQEKRVRGEWFLLDEEDLKVISARSLLI